MSHSVQNHLRLDLADYDETIRRFIRAYDEMLDVAVAAVMETPDLERVYDLGAGTGALSERLLEKHPTCTVELWDVDAGMLEQAQARLERFGDRVVPRRQSFMDLDGEACAMMASLSLHHVLDMDTKTTLYCRIASCLRRYGCLVNADVTISADPATAEDEYHDWVAHQMDEGFTAEQAWKHFDEWAEEDRYFPLERELEALGAAGLVATTPWRMQPSTVMVGTRMHGNG